MNIQTIINMIQEGIAFQKRDVGQDYYKHNIKNRSIHHFSTRIKGDLVDVMFELERDEYYVEFAVNESMELAGNKGTSFAMQVMSYVATCIKHISDNSNVSKFYFLSDAAHEQKYDKLMPILSNKFNFLVEKQPVPSNMRHKRKRADKNQQVPQMTAMYILNVHK